MTQARFLLPDSPTDVALLLRKQGYVPDETIATVLFLADRMGKPILVEGPAGVGKTELAKAVADAAQTELIRLQCYEGLDEAKALYEWEYPKQLLYTQILRDKIGEILAGATSLADAVGRLASQEDAFFSERFLLHRPLLRAIRAERRSVLLIDEVDRAEQEFEAFLLEVLSDFQVTVPELGTLRATHVPMVLLTSNNVRELSDALKRRCLHLFLDYPTATRELEIVSARLGALPDELGAEVIRVVQRLRTLDLKKKPSVAETLDWIRALLLLGAKTLDPALARSTLALVLKHEADITQAEQQWPELFPA